MDLPVEAVALVATVAMIRRDAEAGCCTPERLEAKLRRLEQLVEDIFGPAAEAPEFEVTIAGIQYAAGSPRPGYMSGPPRLRLATIDGEPL